MYVRSTTILCLVAIAAVIGAIVVERTGNGSPRRSEAAAVPLLAPDELPVDRITRVTLDRAGEPRLVFEFDGGAWTQVEPFPFAMDPFSMQQLATTAAGLRSVGEVDVTGADAPTRAALGLDPPRAALTFEWPAGRLGLSLGRRGLGGVAYVAVAGRDGAAAVGQEMHERVIDMDPREWRDRRLFRDVGIDSERIEIMHGSTLTVLERDRRAWKMTAPVQTRLDPRALGDLFTALGRSQSSGFMLDDPQDLGRFGLATPAASIAVTTSRVTGAGAGAAGRAGGAGDEPTGTDPATADSVVREVDVQRLSIGARIGIGAKERFGLVDGQAAIVRIQQPVWSSLLPTPDALVARTGCGVLPADVKSIRIKTDGADFTLQRDLQRWIAPDDGGREVPVAVVEQLLKDLTQVQATAIALRDYPREWATATVTLVGFDERPLDSVRIAREPVAAGDRWIMENGDNVLRVFPASVALPLAPSDYGL